MANLIPIKDDPNHTFTINLDSKLLKLEFLYNSLFDFWAMTIYNDLDDTLIAGVKIVPNYLLLYNNKASGLPSGDFYCEISDFSSSIGRNSFSSKEANLLYLTKEETKLVRYG